MNPAIFGVKPVGLSWTKNQITTAGRVFYDIAFDGTNYMIIGDNLSSTAYGYFTTNPAGAWTQRTLPGLGSSVKGCATNGSRFVSVGNGSVVNYTDNAGVSFTNAACPLGSWRKVNYGGGQFVAVGESSGCMTSPDGATWTSRTISTGDWRDVFYGNGLYVAVGRSGAIATSPDGITWTSRTSGTTDALYRVRYKSGVWCAVGAPLAGGAARVLVSYDGITWSNQTMPAQAENFNGLCSHKNWFLATPQATTYVAQIWRSISGLSNGWSSSASGIPSSVEIRSIVSDGTNIVATYNESSDHGVLISS